MKAQLALGILALSLLSACGGDTSTQTAADEAEARDSSVFEPMTSTIDRAEEVQQTVDAQAEALRRRIEEAER